MVFKAALVLAVAALYVADAKGTVCPLCLDQHPQSSLHPANFRLLPRFGSIGGPV